MKTLTSKPDHCIFQKIKQHPVGKTFDTIGMYLRKASGDGYATSYERHLSKRQKIPYKFATFADVGANSFVLL